MNRILLYLAFVLIALLATAFISTYPTYRRQMKEAAKRIATESQILETEFGELEFATRGEGKAVLLIHGAGGGFDQGLWLGHLCLTNNYQLIAPSKMGYLNSALPHYSSIEIQAGLYKALLNHLGIAKVIVIGVSAGGTSAMQFAADYPEMTTKLVLLSAVSMPPNAQDKSSFFIAMLHAIQKSDYLYWLFTKLFESQILSLMGIPGENYEHFTPEQKALAKEMLDIMHPMSERHKGTIADGLMIREFNFPQDIKAPTLIIHSRNDGLVSLVHAEYANKRIVGSKIIVYENGGHGALSELDDARRKIALFLSESHCSVP